METESIVKPEVEESAETKAQNEKKLLKEIKEEGKEIITLERFRIAAEKLQLAWLRKAMAISALGFTAYRLLEDETAKGEHDIFGFLGAGEIGLVMLLIGFIGLVWATQQHLLTLKKVKQQFDFYNQKLPISISLIESYALIIVTLMLSIYSIVRYIKL
jgi:uncharacterized membrane protein YidH (DUF202 family)